MRHDQLRAIGLTQGQITYRRKIGRLFEVYPLVYTVGGRGLSERGSWSAAVLAAGKGAVLSHQPAGKLRGLLTYHDGPIHVTVPRANAPELEGVRTHVGTFGPYETGSRHNIAATSTTRTLLDLATVLSTRDLIRAFQRGLERGTSIRQLDRLLTAHRGERGTLMLRRLTDLYRQDDGTGKGGFEDAFWLWLVTILPKDFPRPKRNQRIELSDGTWIEADLLAGRTILELDYFDHHGGNRYQTTLDHQRDRAVRNDGWTLERFTSDEFALDRPRVERDVRRLLGIEPR